MSEAYTPPAEVEGGDGDAPEPEVEDHEEGDESEGGEDDGEPSQSKAVDWEKRAHDKAGQAAKERSRRRAVERSLTEMQTRFDALESRIGNDPDELAALIAGLRDDDDQPITDIGQIKKALKLFLAQQEQDTQSAVQQQKTVRAVEGMMRNMSEYEADFASDHPDYFQAAKFYREGRQAELEDLGYSGQTLQQHLARDLFSAVRTALDGGRDPAEVVYGLAKRRGFVAGKQLATDKLQKLQRASAAGQTPSGRAPSAGLSWGSVAKLKGAERDKAFKALRAKELGKG